jgi:hypothetical protein
MERTGGFEHLLKMLGMRGAPTGLRPGGAVGYCPHLLPTAPLILVLVMVTLGRCRVTAAVPTTDIGDSFGLATEVGLDHLLASGILGGDIQEFPHCALGLMAERMDERLTGHAADEGIDHVGVDDVGELIVLLGEALNVLLEGLLRPLPTAMEVP